MIQDFLSHGISIPIGSSNKFTQKLVKMSIKIVTIAHWSMPYGQPYGIDQCATVTILMQHFHKFFGKFITGPYWNAYPMT